MMFITLFLAQCVEKKLSFYKDYMESYDSTPGDDAWRLPIIEPYELITANCCTGWIFQGKGSSGNFSSDSINFNKNYIIFIDSFHRYGYFNINNNKISLFKNYQQYINFTKKVGISSRLYNTKDVFTCWHETGQLPWGQEILQLCEFK